MIRVCRLVLAFCSVALVSSLAAAQPAPRGECLSSDAACSAILPGLAAMGSLILAPKADRDASAGKTPALAVAPLTVAEPATRARLQIEVHGQEALPKTSFIRIRGLPPAIALPQGHAIAAGSWAVPLYALPDLTISLPEGLQGSSEMTIALVTVEGAVLAESRMRLVVASTAQKKDLAGSANRATPEDRERALQLHAKGLAQLEIGNIVAARRFFELATAAGLAQSVMALAATYDPNELAKLGNLGPRPDVEVARHWYHKARELGAADAEQRLQRLGLR